jgi:hypothetical protein
MPNLETQPGEPFLNRQFPNSAISSQRKPKEAADAESSGIKHPRRNTYSEIYTFSLADVSINYRLPDANRANLKR